MQAGAGSVRFVRSPFPAFGTAVGCTLAVLLGSGCAMPRLDVIPRVAMFDVEGDIGIETGSVSATNDVERAGLEKDETAFGGRIDLDWSAAHVTLTTQDSTHDGDGILDADVSQGGTTITAGTAVASDLDLGLHTFAITFDLLPTEMFELGLGLGVTAIDIDAAFTSQVNGDQVATDETVPVPVIAARGGVVVGPFDASLLAQGMTVKYSGDEATYYDLDLMARFRLFGERGRFLGALTAGWREVGVDAEYEDGGEDIEADVNFRGPYLGFTFGF